MLRSSAAGHRARTRAAVAAATLIAPLGMTAAAQGRPTCAPAPDLQTTTSQAVLVPVPACADPQGPPPEISVARPPRNGTLSEPGRDGARSYVADAGFHGVDSVIFAAGDPASGVRVRQVILVRADRRLRRRGADDGAGDVCAPRRGGEHCAAGGGRQTRGGGGTGKVTHEGWPAVTGILWKVVSNGTGRHAKTGGPDSDELLGHHGSDTIFGAGGSDILWGDWDPSNNNTGQHDELRGGPGNDWLYSSHGQNEIYGGAGTDHVWAYYGRGVIDCGPGDHDVARTKLGAPFAVRNCETIGHFCAFGPDGHGGCLKPGETRATRRRARARPAIR